MFDSIDHQFMQRAIELAEKGGRAVAPNPRVGAVFVRENIILAEGYHHHFGGPHAEIDAIQAAKRTHRSLKGSTLYVTLEPCCHHGKQGPCTQALIQNEVACVVYAEIDPNPIVYGKGKEELEQHDIITYQLFSPEAKRLNEIYVTNTLLKRPFIHLKTALTKEGKITTNKGKQAMLTQKKWDKKVHALRATYDGVVVGINTILIDNPRLTARQKGAQNPVRIILDSKCRIPHNAQIFQEKGITLIATSTRPPLGWTPPSETEILICKKNAVGRVDLNDLLTQLLERNIRSLLLEGGEQVNTAFLEKGLVDRISLALTTHTAQEDAPALFNSKHIKDLNLIDATLKIENNEIWIEGRLQKITNT